MSADRRLIVSLAALFCLFAAACGSTVPIAQQEAVETGALATQGDGLSAGLPEGTHINDKGQVVTESGEVLGDAEDFGLSPSGSGGGTVASTDTPGTGDTPTDGGDTAAPPPSSGGNAPAGANGPGITADTIKIGISYADDAEEANAAIGAAGATQINQKQAWEAMLKYVNGHGGVNGRELVPVWHKLSATSTEAYDQQDQEVCAHWTQDDPVFVSDGAFKTENGISCFQENGLVTIATNGLRYKSRAFFDRYPTYLEFDGVDNDSIAAMYADNMKKMGLFDQGHQLGIVTWDDPEYATPTKNTLIPRLQKMGVNVADVQYITTPDSGGEVAGPIGQVGNTAVRFKGEGITHVMFMDLGANLAFFFMQAAQRQQYAPRYGLTSASGNSALMTVAGDGSKEDFKEQLKDAVAIGWVPTIDVNAGDAPSWTRTNAKKVCYQIMREGGIKLDSANAKGLAEGVCDNAWTIQSTLEAAGPVINQETWYKGLAKASGTPLTGGMGFRISSTRRDGIETAAQLKFFSDCVCFKYTSSRFAVPE